MTINTKILQLAAQAHCDVDAYATADLLRDAAGEIDAQAAEIASRKSMFDLVVNSVCAALERAGVEAVDDPGEAIDVLVADKDREIARLRDALWVVTEHNALHFGESHNTVVVGRAALAQEQS